MHTATWPTVEELPTGGDPGVLVTAGQVLSALRKVKSDHKVSMRARLAHAMVKAPAAQAAQTQAAAADLQAAGGLDTGLQVQEADEFSVIAELA